MHIQHNSYTILTLHESYKIVFRINSWGLACVIFLKYQLIVSSHSMFDSELTSEKFHLRKCATSKKATFIHDISRVKNNSFNIELLFENFWNASSIASSHSKYRSELTFENFYLRKRVTSKKPLPRVICTVMRPCVAACGSVLQCVAMCCSVLQCVAVNEPRQKRPFQESYAP